MKYSRVPKSIGIVVDMHHPHKRWVHELIQKVPSKGTVVTTTGSAYVFLEGTVKKRGDLNFEVFTEDEWHTRKKAADIRDWLFISYLEFTKGKLYIFPATYDTKYGKHFSERIQSMIITAHQKGVRYEIVTGE